VPPFEPLTERANGVLLHITSLPSRWGVGDLGPGARRFSTALGSSGQRYWQTLPLNPISTGNSPYVSSSSRAGEPLLLSIEDLCEDRLLRPGEVAAPSHEEPGNCDFDRARTLKTPLLSLAAGRVAKSADSKYLDFCDREATWLDDHALFMVLSRELGPRWRTWPYALRFRDPQALARAAAEHAEAVAIEKALQFLFDRQWQALRRSCEGSGVAMFGDMPIYVSTDSADVWSAPGVFCLDHRLEPTLESGVPPDYFSATGQLWRNPVFNWQALERDGFHWWISRLELLLARFDVLRIDHFRGLAQFWAVPAGAENAMQGEWMDVPSYGLFDTLRSTVSPLPLVAEDLGTITDDVRALCDHYGFPGMIVLQFAFNDDHWDNPYKPENHRENAVAYLGTHDNNTCRAWLEKELDDEGRRRLGAYVAEHWGAEGVEAMIDLLLSSRARTSIVCAQDLLALGEDSRMNIPGVAEGNWHWQLTEAQFAALPLARLAERCSAHGR
jgi:4-alpha-glucanotransferase